MNGTVLGPLTIPANAHSLPRNQSLVHASSFAIARRLPNSYEFMPALGG